MRKNRYLILIPSLNAAKTIKKVILELKKLNMAFDVLIVDNDSPDNTAEAARQAIKELNLKNFIVIKNKRNLGYGGSQKVALSHAMDNKYDKLIVLHADNQYPAASIPSLIKANAETKAAMTVGTRLKHKNVKKVMPRWRYLGNYALSAMNRWAYNLNLDEFNSEFRIYDIEFMKKVDMSKCHNVLSNYTIESIIEILIKKGKIDQIVIPCSYPPDAHHPQMWDLLLYFFYNIYRALRYRLFRK